MGSNYRCSLVVFANNADKLLATYDSIKSGADAASVQIIVVHLPGLKLKEVDVVRNDEDVTWIDKSSNYVTEIKNSIKGGIVSFSKNGVKYEKNSLKKIVAAAEKNDSEVTICKVRTEFRTTKIMREHNAFCNEAKNGISLNDNHKILNVFYYAYFFKKDSIKWTDEISDDLWHFDLLRLMYNNMVSVNKVSSVKNQFVVLDTGVETIDDWSAFIDKEGNAENLFENFFEPMYEIYEDDSVINHMNAEYVLLYFFARFERTITKINETPEFEKYQNLFREFASGIKNINIIIVNQYINRWHKYYIMKNYISDDENFYAEDIREAARDILNSYRVRLLFYKIKDGVVRMELSKEEKYDSDRTLYIKCNDDKVEPKEVINYRENTWGEGIVSRMKMYIFEFKLPDTDAIINVTLGDDIDGYIEELVYTKFCPFSSLVAHYVTMDGRLTYQKKNTVYITKNGALKRFGKGLLRNLTICKNGKAGVKAFAARFVYFCKKNSSKKIWLVSDRTNRGDDNGEVFYEYLCNTKIPGVDAYYVIDKDTEEWEKIGKYGQVIAPFSWQHKMKHLLSEFVISSQANNAVINPFNKFEYLYRDIMYKKPIVFLQHGVIKDDLSDWLNRYNRDLFGFVTTTKPEYDSILNYNYYYSPDEVWLTGLPRHDKLYHDERKYVTVMPTWRKSLTAGTDDKGVWVLGEEFIRSSYFNFYNDLLNHERLLAEMKKRGYTLCFMPHPNAMPGIPLFTHHPDVKFFDESDKYREVFARTNLMLTDYSSVAFDFAYLRKPIIYAQFDRNEFFNGDHSYVEGYYDYMKDGFGEIDTELEAVVDRIIEYMDRDCELKPEYRDRINKTFAYSDKDCSKRVVDKIMKYRNGK